MELPALLNPDGLMSIENNVALRYPRDYTRAMTVLGRKEWITLKKKLSSPDADEVVVALNNYITTILEDRAAIEAHDAFDCRILPNTRDMTILQHRWDEMNRLRREARCAMRNKSIARYRLMELLVGKENICFEPPHYSDSDYDDSDEDYGDESE